MILIIKDKKTGNIHEVLKFLASTGGGNYVWSLTWPGRHQVGQDCEMVPMEEDEWRKISFIRENPEMSIRQICKTLRMKYETVYALTHRYNLTVRRERLRES